MALQNTATLYGSVTKSFHWLTALLIVTVIPLGIIANGIAYDINDPAIPTTQEDVDRAAFLFSLHKTIGLTIFFTALARILWAVSQPKPGLLNGDKPAESFLAGTVHWLLYGSLLLVPMTGWIHHAATEGFAPIWWPFGQNLPFVPKDPDVAHTFASLHIIFERVLVVALALHVIGALKHHFFDKDLTLRRMLPGRSPEPQIPVARESRWPIAGAAAAYAVALGIGTSLGLFSHTEGTADAAQLEVVESDWVVENGTLGLTVTQFGSAVEGSFADWTAAISFDETGDLGPRGSVEVTVAIGSLTLGSVTSQALGADFFDAETHPTATFSAEIIGQEDEIYTAEGELTLKGATRPLSLPFELEIIEGVATMRGQTTINRRDFGIGENMADESALAFAVDVAVELTARRAAED